MIIEMPEVGSVYLVRRSKGGPVRARHQPARILERTIKSDGEFKGLAHLKVLWLIENKEEDNILEFYGCVKELPEKFLRDEIRRCSREVNELECRKIVLHYLQQSMFPKA